MHPVTSRQQRGFSLVELMVGLAAGLIVTGAVVSFTVTTLRSNTANMQSSRLTQDLRTSMSLVTREVRRSGYDSGSVANLGLGTPLSAFTALQAPPFGPAGCITYQYNRTDGDQYRAIRLSGGSLEMATSAAAMADCNAGTWSAISDPDVVTITGFAPSETREAFASIVRTRVVAGDTEALAGCGVVRNISIDITGSLVADAGISRTIHEEIRVRADPLTFVSQTYPGNGLGIPSAAEECALMNLCLAPYGQTAPDCP